MTSINASSSAMAGGNIPAVDESLIRSQVQQRFAEMFLSQNRRAQAGLLVAALLVAFIWFHRTGSDHALYWAAAALAVTAARFCYSTRFVRKSAEGATRRIALLLLLNGLLMSIPLVEFGRLTELERAAVSIILLAAATASTATTAGYRNIFLAFAAPMLLTLAAAWMATKSQDQSSAAAIGLGMLIVLFLLFLIGVAHQVNQVFEESTRYRYGEQQLNSELKRALEEADQSNRAKTQFLAAASHDLRQPIHSMSMLTAALTLRETDSVSSEIVSLLDNVNQALSKQLDSLLDISKLDAGTIHPKRETVRLDLLVRTHEATLAPAAAERGLKLEVAASDQVSVDTDEALLRRVLNNLTDNALKFTPPGGTVRMEVKQQAADALLTISDTGIGIPSAEHDTVFREFYQVANTERDRSKGLGLGLSIVRRLCHLLGVTLSLESAQGVGTSVTLTMPSVAAAESWSTPTQTAALPDKLGVLVIDDEETVRSSMRLLLTGLGCVVRLADGTDQAIEQARLHPIDVVLSDFRLRGSDSGPAAIRAVRKILPNVRAVLITGDTAPDRLRDAQATGVPLLFKPVTLSDLLTALGADAT